MGSFLRYTSLLLCVAAGIGVAVWLAGPAEPQPLLSDAPPWSAQPSSAPPLVLIPKEGDAPTAASPPTADDPVTIVDVQPKSDSARVVPVVLPPSRAVAENVAEDIAAQEPAAESSMTSIPGLVRSLLGGPKSTTTTTSRQSPSASASTKPSPLVSSAGAAVGEAAADADTRAAAQESQSVTPPPPGQGNQGNGANNGQPRTPLVTPEGDGRLSLHLMDTDIREVLQMLSRGSGIAIMPSDTVQGKISATLPNVDFQTALTAILKSKGFIWRREGNVIYVGTQDEFKKRDLTSGRVSTRLYRPNYVRAAELQKLITSLLTPSVGTITVTSPSGVGIGADSSTAGGDDYANGDVVLVRDYESVLLQIDRIFREVDIQPLQVHVEAMILSVKLNDTMDVGVDFELLRDNDNLRIVSGNPIQSLASLQVGKGLKIGYLDTNVSVFIKALETIGETNVIATPRILALNKMRAEVLIGAQLGYVSTTVTETSTTQAVQFLEVGTQLRIRPFISNDGMIRMEVHPELSTGNVRVVDGLTLPDKEVTGVTTNIMARDGSTVIIGGLIRNDQDKQATQIPLLGSLPVVGAAFRQKVEKTDRREIIVLLTPRIVCDPELKREGNLAAMEFHHRQAVVGEKMSHFSKVHLCKKYIYLAQQAWAAGNQQRALRLINLAIHFDPENRSAIDLRADIVGGVHFGNHTGQGPFLPPPEAAEPALDGPEIAPWVLDDLDPATTPPAHPLPHSQGVPGEQIEVPSPETP